MPANLAVRPLGKVTSRAFGCWEPSGRESFKTKGLYAPASGAIVPAVKVGLLGASASLLGRGPLPPAATAVWKESEGWASAPSGVDQGVRVEVVVLAPQVSGVFRAAL